MAPSPPELSSENGPVRNKRPLPSEFNDEAPQEKAEPEKPGFNLLDLAYDEEHARKRRRTDKKFKQWPKSKLNFRLWDDDDAVDCIKDVLLERGWNFDGGLCKDPNDWGNGAEMVCSYSSCRPEYCLFWTDEYEAAMLLDLPKRGPNRYLLSAFPGMTPATFKTNTTKLLRGKPWYPETHIIPHERESLMKVLSKEAENGEVSYWIGKPKDDYGGTGCVVYSSDSEGFRDAIQSNTAGVLQRYITNPLLIGGYKFHIRCYIVVLSLDPLEAYVHREYKPLTSTEPFTMDKGSLHPTFDGYNHLTNSSLNLKPNNVDRLNREKPGIGYGNMLSRQEFEDYLTNNYENFDKDDMLKQIVEVCGGAMEGLSRWPQVRKYASRRGENRHFGVMGYDLMIDEDMKVWLLECNSTPGMNYIRDIPGLREELATKRSAADAARKAVLHDVIDVLGVDNQKMGPGGWIRITDKPVLTEKKVNGRRKNKRRWTKKNTLRKC